jgi:hypothetical protein
MLVTKNWKLLFVIGILILFFVIYQVLTLRKAHSTFENYYAFRECIQLIQKRQDYGICKTSSNQIIKIVKFKNRWFLDGDLPCGFLCF